MMTKLGMARQIIGLKVENHITLLDPSEINQEVWAKYASKSLTRKDLKEMLQKVVRKVNAM